MSAGSDCHLHGEYMSHGPEKWYGILHREPYHLKKWYGFSRVCRIGSGASGSEILIEENSV